ncbi:DUF4649 family protein [Streptococcus cameli]
MLEITYLDASKLKKTISFDSYEEYQRSQQACMIGIADHYKVVSLVYNGHDLGYTGTYGDIFFYLMNKDLSSLQ